MWRSSPCLINFCPRRSGPSQRRLEHRENEKVQDSDKQQDQPYLQELITNIESEMAEREDLEAMIITKRQKNSQAGH